MFKKLSFRLSFVLIIILGVIVTIFTTYLVNDRSKQMKEMILKKGIAAAQTGAKIMGEILDNVVENEIFTEQELFDYTLVPIPLDRSIIASYRKIPLNKINDIQKYHYKTGLDKYLDTLIVSIQDEFFKDPQLIFAVLCDNNGYTPSHNTIYNKNLTGNYEKDNEESRSKRVFYDNKVAENTVKPYMLEVYQRDTGEEMWKISSPVFVKNKHWGSFRIGFSMKKTEEAINDLAKRLIIMMAVMLLITVIVINRATAYMMKPLNNLNNGVDRVSKGDLSFKIIVKTDDEIGDLAKAFNKMTSDLNEYIENLQKTTAIKERIQSELNVGKDIQKRMLPHVFPPFPHRNEIDIYAIMEPAKEVAGDFYDFFFIDEDNFCFIISDVSGKGVPSALFMVITKTLLKTESQRAYALEKVAYNVNNALSKDNETAMFATMFIGVLNLKTGILQFVNAGHNPPITGNDEIGYTYLNVNQNIALGILENFKFKAEEKIINVKDKILLYTDGITEAFDEKGKIFSDESLLAVVNNMKDEGSEYFVKKIRKEIKNFTKDAEQSDDITILAITYNGNE
ncbi:MAG: SpoIIE family protein phosphatase [Bacteroidales bacterium]|nr:SpoIIE family protein phosphatase [Bacteroidales bacterium]MBN2758126.1 SpoIIE family protein phosphatase [Bacteroidales bacterium]